LDPVNEQFSPNETAADELVQHVSVFYGSQRQRMGRGSHIAEVWIEMIDTEFRVARIDDVSHFWKQQIGDVADIQQLTFEQPMLGPELRPIQIALQGDSLETLDAAGVNLQHRLSRYAGVKNVQTDLKPGKEEVRIRLKESAHALGVTSQLVAHQLRAGFFGERVQQFQRGDEVVDVRVMLHCENRSSLADVEYFQLLTPAGARVPLYEVAHTDVVRGYSSMSRLDGRPVVHVSADVDPALGNAAAILSKLTQSDLPELQREFSGVSIRIRGEAEETEGFIGNAIRRTVIGGLLIFVVLSFAFRSYIEPFIVLLAVPLGGIGVVVGHLLLGMDLSLFSVIGLISLAGILVNDSIVMVEFIKLRLAEGTSPNQAFSRAGRERFRAVVLTTATTIMGLLPMLLETSLQATVFKGLVVSIMFGELFSTAMILVLVPCSYSVLHDLGLISQRQGS
jgi:multidrug efflux pump subunit AcrB